MQMRSTMQVRVNNLVSVLQRSQAKQTTLQNSISSGIRLRQPSDGPAQFIDAQAKIAAAERLAAYRDSATSATNDLNASVSALLAANNSLTQANEIALSSVHDSLDPTAYVTMAAQIEEIIQRVLTVANSEANGRSLFAGAADRTAAYAITARDGSGRATAITYQGDAERSRAIVGAGETVDVRYSGSDVFKSTGGDVFQTLIGLRDELLDPNLSATARAQAITERIKQIKAARDSILSAVGEQSASLEQLEAADNRMSDLQLSLQARAGDLQGTDYAEAIARLSEEQTVYQATLAMTSRVFGPMLFDYLK